MKGILGKKIGMTQVFTESGKLIPVTVIEVEPNVVTQIKTVEKDGYDAIQLGAVTIKEKSSNKPKMGHTAKANTAPKRFLKEIRGVNVNDYTLGQVISADIFTKGEMVDVSGISKGKGFQGVIKRVSVELENNVILIKGNVPGPKKSLVMIKTSVKKGEKINDMENLITYEVIEEKAEETEDTTNEVVEGNDSTPEDVASVDAAETEEVNTEE